MTDGRMEYERENMKLVLEGYSKQQLEELIDNLDNSLEEDLDHVIDGLKWKSVYLVAVARELLRDKRKKASAEDKELQEALKWFEEEQKQEEEKKKKEEDDDDDFFSNFKF